ncbi:hypothetical protein [Ruegeria sp.]|uniref:hypothetical protein n=1 Tax=Ruegeria sp. TaxID=1879320 RepID=UPI003B590D14
MTATVTASDVNRAIKAKYSDQQWRVWFEVSQGTGHHPGRRADAVVMNIWPSKAYQLHVFEVKVSRADFKNEMADLTKWQAVGKYADFFWLACPVGLVKPDEVPEAWGLMELTKGGLRIKKQAPAREDPTPLDRSFAASLLRSGEDLTEAEIEKRVNERAEAATADIKEAAERGYNRSLASLQSKLERMEKWKSEFEKTFKVEPNIHSYPEDMAARLTLASQLERKSFDGLARQAKALAELIEQIEAT